jgi:hypothetical protein
MTDGQMEEGGSGFLFASVKRFTRTAGRLSHDRAHDRRNAMNNHFQESLMDSVRPTRPAYVQMAVGLVLVLAIAAFGMLAASHAPGEQKTAVLPSILLFPETPVPGLEWTLATGDGGAAIAPAPSKQDKAAHEIDRFAGTSPRAR